MCRKGERRKKTKRRILIQIYEHLIVFIRSFQCKAFSFYTWFSSSWPLHWPMHSYIFLHRLLFTRTFFFRSRHPVHLLAIVTVGAHSFSISAPSHPQQCPKAADFQRSPSLPLPNLPFMPFLSANLLMGTQTWLLTFYGRQMKAVPLPGKTAAGHHFWGLVIKTAKADFSCLL